MWPTRNSRDLVILTHDTLAMPASRDPVIDQPRENLFARRFISVSEILADSSLPGTEWLRALLDHRVARAGMTGSAGRVLLLHMRCGGETQTLRGTQRVEWFRGAKKLDRVLNCGPTFLSR